MADRRVGRFRITGPLGKGGMATVWRAEDELLGRTVALKLLADDLAGSPSARRRFRHEAEIATRLDHPNIVPVLAHGEDEGATWIAMGLIDGESVAARLARSLPTVDEALRIAAEVADALGYAHAQGVVHRDVSANNVMLGRDGRVYVLDFGLARAEGLSRVTSTGVAIGTFHYLAPEVLSGTGADERSDLYGLGIVLYEMLTGTTPFAGGRLETVRYRVVNEDPEPPSTRRAGLPAALDALVLRAIARLPGERFADAAEFAAEMARVRADCGREGGGPVGAAAATVPLARTLSGSGPLYLAVAPIESPAGELAGLAGAIEAALRARLPVPRRVVLVQPPAPADPATWREFCRGAGATAVLAGRLRRAGARTRLELWISDPESGARLAGTCADELAFETFEAEDAAVEHARDMLGLSSEIERADTQPVRHDPAAAEHFAQAQRHLVRHDQESSVDAAIGLLERLTATESPHAEWYAAFARALLMKYALTHQRAWESRAADACARAMALAPDAPEVQLARADLLTLAGREVEALRAYESMLAARPACSDALLGLVTLHGRAGRMELAERAARRAIETAPGDWRAHNALGWAWFRFGRFEEAIAPLRRAAELSPDNARVRRYLAVALAQCDRLAESVELLREVVTLDPSDSAYANLGAALFRLGERAEALEALERATRLAPADAMRWGNYACALRFEPGREAEAARTYDRAIVLMQDQLARNPGSAELWAHLADWLQTRGRADEADAALRRALAIAPDNVDCMVHAAYVVHQRGDRKATLEWLRSALQHGYGAQMLRQSAEFRDLQDDPEFRSLLETVSHRHGTGSTAQGGAHREEGT